MSDLQISAGTAAEFRSGMTTVLDVITRSAPLVPAELQDDWGVLTDGTSRVVALLDKPGASVYSAAEIYREPGYVGAMERTDAWMEASCAR